MVTARRIFPLMVTTCLDRLFTRHLIWNNSCYQLKDLRRQMAIYRLLNLKKWGYDIGGRSQLKFIKSLFQVLEEQMSSFLLNIPIYANAKAFCCGFGETCNSSVPSTYDWILLQPIGGVSKLTNQSQILLHHFIIEIKTVWFFMELFNIFHPCK